MIYEIWKLMTCYVTSFLKVIRNDSKNMPYDLSTRIYSQMMIFYIHLSLVTICPILKISYKSMTINSFLSELPTENIRNEIGPVNSPKYPKPVLDKLSVVSN